MFAQEPTELAAILEGAYWTFLHLRLARRRSERGKVHARSFRSFMETARELLDVEGSSGALRVALEDVCRARCPIEEEVVGGTTFLDVEHEWANFVVLVTNSIAAR